MVRPCSTSCVEELNYTRLCTFQGPAYRIVYTHACELYSLYLRSFLQFEGTYLWNMHIMYRYRCILFFYIFLNYYCSIETQLGASVQRAFNQLHRNIMDHRTWSKDVCTGTQRSGCLDLSWGFRAVAASCLKQSQLWVLACIGYIGYGWHEPEHDAAEPRLTAAGVQMHPWLCQAVWLPWSSMAIHGPWRGYDPSWSMALTALTPCTCHICHRSFVSECGL